MTDLDLNLLPLVRQGGQDLSELPGLYAVTAPKRAARGRSSDSLVFYFNMTGTAPISAEQNSQLLTRLAQTYYQTPGTVTSALRLVADTLNQYLLDRNLRASTTGHQAVGILTLVVLRDGHLTLAQCGPTHVYLIAPKGAQHLFDPEGSGRGLGLSRTASLRYFQTDLQPNEYALITAQPPTAWSEAALQSVYSAGLESMRRRLLSAAGAEVNAVLIQAQEGQGKIRMLRPKGGPTVAPAAPEPEGTAVVQPVTQGMAQETGEEVSGDAGERGSEGAGEAGSKERPAGTSEPASVRGDPAPIIRDEPSPVSSRQASSIDSASTLRHLPPAVEQAPAAGQTTTETSRRQTAGGGQLSQARPAARWLNRTPASKPSNVSLNPAVGGRAGAKKRPALPKINMAPLTGVLAAIGRAFGGAAHTIGEGVRALLKRMLPDQSLFTIPTSFMIFCAIAVPVVMVVAGGMVYLRIGRAKQFQTYYNQALAAAAQAKTQSDPAAMRSEWAKVLEELNQAEYFQVMPESQALRSEATGVLDGLDGIIRLNYQPAIIGVTSSLGEMTKVTRIVATTTELYMLDGTSGKVQRAIYTNNGYDIDNNFVCGPTPGPIIVGPLVDIAPLPKGREDKASLMGMDAQGRLVFCIAGGGNPFVDQLAAPSTNWGAPQAMMLDTGDLYVLDSKANAVWIYRGSALAEQPRLFFGEQVPNMADVIDLAVNRDDLYLLHDDGSQTLCIFSGLKESPTHCDDPFPYTDPRPGRQSEARISDAVFSQMWYYPPPDPSIYLLDPASQAIYHFSLRMTFQRQFRPAKALSNQPATAFAVSTNRIAFLAIGNQVYYATLP